jgi:hypothetical protein
VKLLAEVPIRNQVHRYDGGSFTVSDLKATTSSLSLLYTARSAQNWERWFGPGDLALVNRKTGEVIEAAQVDFAAGGAMISLFQVSVNSAWVRFRIPDRHWLDEATLVVFGVTRHRTISCDVPIFVRPALEVAPLFPPPPSVSAEVLQEYAGKYQPRPGAILKVDVRGSSLSLRDTGFHQIILHPVTETRFATDSENWLFAESGGFTVDFVRDDHGVVTHFVVTQNGRTYQVPKIRDGK